MTRFIIFLSIVTVVILTVDFYGSIGLRQLTLHLDPFWRRFWKYVYWIPTALTFLLIIFTILRVENSGLHRPFGLIYFVIGFSFLFFLPKLTFFVFHFFNDLTRGLQWVFSKLSQSPVSAPEERISRMQFFNQAGLAVTTFMFGSMIYGITRGKYAFRTLSEKIIYSDLPRGFDRVRIVHISDIHIGSFGENFDKVKTGIEMINALEADFVMFTGDLVNNFADEAEPWIEILSSIKARYGKYSIFGNHDYSDYVEWPNTSEKMKNLEKLVRIHEKIGFQLLRNENTLIEMNGSSVRLLGMENWGIGFQQYGDFEKTLMGSSANEFRILLSHDPTHWESQVMGKENIQLTLSGHTHGMQFGIEVPSLGIKISPSRLRYKHWGGLYSEGKQRLYVNRGFGFLGFPGRVGMPPEITLIELHKG